MMPKFRFAVRRGMTLIEVLFAVVIMSGVMLSLSRFGQGFARASRNAAYLTIASDLATGRLEAARSHGTYSTLVSTFHNTTETSATSGANPSMAGYAGYTRTTLAVSTVTDSTDFVTVTVTVSSPDLSTPVSKTVIIGAF
ncbi:MAG: hypothetical protein C0503_04485 [Gemmatimonas sp.]|nr:hypothetical protein [Gemmatimonas sp.]